MGSFVLNILKNKTFKKLWWFDMSFMKEYYFKLLLLSFIKSKSLKFIICLNSNWCIDCPENKLATLINILSVSHNASSSTNRKSRSYATKLSKYIYIQINIHRITQCCQRKSTCLYLWRCPWTVLWSHGAFQNRRKHTILQLSLSGRLCWQRILLNRNRLLASCT